LTKPTSSPDDSAEKIVNTIGLNLSFFEDPSERHLTGLEIALGYLLLGWFAEGFTKGAGEAAGKQFEEKAAATIPRLATRVKGWFGRSNPTPESDAAATQQLAIATKTAVDDAQPKVAELDEEVVTTIGDAYQQALHEYLKDIGMLAPDAAKVALTVREEAQNQVRPE
jgi:hypothetical protein